MIPTGWKQRLHWPIILGPKAKRSLFLLVLTLICTAIAETTWELSKDPAAVEEAPLHQLLHPPQPPLPPLHPLPPRPPGQSSSLVMR